MVATAAQAQWGDYAGLFHYGRINSPKTIFLCRGNDTHTVWMNNVVDYFKFDEEGNLVSHGDEVYTRVVRDEKNCMEKAVLGDLRVEVINLQYSDNKRIIVVYYDGETDDDLKWADEYVLNKKGFPEKRIRKFPSGEKSTRTYKYVEYRDDGVWYIRKVKDPEGSWYECLKTM